MTEPIAVAVVAEGTKVGSESEAATCDRCDAPAIVLNDYGRGRIERLCSLHANVGIYHGRQAL